MVFDNLLCGVEMSSTFYSGLPPIFLRRRSTKEHQLILVDYRLQFWCYSFWMSIKYVHKSIGYCIVPKVGYTKESFSRSEDIARHYL